MRAQTPIPNRGDDPAQRPARLRIAETFVSLQGEGLLTGTRSFFIRTSGCNLRCWFCDTPYASWQPEGEGIDIRQLVDDAIGSGCDHVVLTGGEPMLPLQCVELVGMLRQSGLHVTIETAGTIHRPLVADLMSISPKLSGSGPRSSGEPHQSDLKWRAKHDQTRWRPEVIHALIAAADQYQIKFVVDDASDWNRCAVAATQLSVPADHIWIMPQGTDVTTLDRQAQWLRPKAEAMGFRYCDRMHVRWYGNRRGT